MNKFSFKICGSYLNDDTSKEPTDKNSKDSEFDSNNFKI